MKKLGIVAGILLVFLVGGALVAPSFVDWNKYKTEIETTASDLSERTVKINGNLSLSILPSPAFSAENVSVSNVQGGVADTFVTLKSVDVNVAFFPLLSGDFQVKKFILVEPVIALEVDENGKGNWEFGSEGDAESSSAAELSFEQFQIKNGQISYQDLSTGFQELLRGINAEVTMDSLNGPFEIDGDVRYKNLPVSAKVMVGTIRDGRKIPVNISSKLMTDDIEIKFVGGIDLNGASPAGDGKINVVAGDVGDIMTALSLLDPESTNQNGPQYNQPLSLETTVAYGGDAINISTFEFEMGESRGSGNLKATFGALTRFDGGLNVNSFDLDSFLNATEESSESSPDDEKTDYAFLNGLEGAFEFKLGALQYNAKIASQLEMTLTAGDGGIEFSNAGINMPGGSELAWNGTLSLPDNKPQFIGDLKLGSGNLRAFLEWLKVNVTTIPRGRLTRLSYASAIRADESLIQLYGIDGALDTFQFKGGLSYALQERPSFGIDAEVTNLNVHNYLPEQNDDPLNLREMAAMLADFDANYNVKMTALTSGGITVKEATLSGELFDGNLNVKTINIDDYAGFDLNGSLIGSSLGRNPKFETSFNTTAASLVPLQRAYRFKTNFDIAEVGAVAVNARMNGNFEALNVDIKSTVGSSKMDVKGDIRSETLKQLPDIGTMDLTIVGSNPSFASLIDQFDLPLTKPAAADDRQIAINSSIKATQGLVDLDGTVTVAGGDIVLKGRTNLTPENEVSSFDMALDVSGSDMREFIRGLGTDFRPANTQLGPIELMMSASGNMSDVSLKNIAGQLGPTIITGNGDLRALDANPTSGQKSNFDFTLVLDNIPVKDFMEPEPEETIEEDWGNWSEEPLELEVLNNYDGTFRITANAIQYDDYNFENPSFEAVLKDGVININNFTGKLFGGDVNVAGTFNSIGELKMDMALNGATIAEATSTFAGINPVSGSFDMNQSFTGKGLNQRAFISSLNGDGEVVASPGAISGLDIPRLSEQLKDLSSESGFLRVLTATLSGGETPYQGGNSIITMKDGFIQLSPFDIKMLGADSAVNMAINLAEWNLDVSGDMALSEHPDAPPIGLNIVGDLHNPEINYNTKALEGFIGQKIAASMLQNMVESNGGLGNIFGGQPVATPSGTGGVVPQSPPDGATVQTPRLEQEPLPDTQSPLEAFIEPEVAEPEQQAAPEEEKRPGSIEELGTKLLERLFQKPPSRD
jgi:uncharacterized protein involved in outer membrane biogenesis